MAQPRGRSGAISKKRGSLLSMQLAYLESESPGPLGRQREGDSWIPRVINHLREKGKL